MYRHKQSDIDCHMSLAVGDIVNAFADQMILFKIRYEISCFERETCQMNQDASKSETLHMIMTCNPGYQCQNISKQNDTKYIHLTWPIVCRWRFQMYATRPQYLNSLALFITIPNKVYKVYNTLRIICIQHYNDVIMNAVVSQITSVSIVRSTVGSGANQRKHQSSASLAFVREFTSYKRSVTRKMFPFYDVIMNISWHQFMLGSMLYYTPHMTTDLYLHNACGYRISKSFRLIADYWVI